MSEDALTASKSLARVVLPLMARHGVPITPENFTIWYNYAAGGNDPLRRVLDGLMEKGEPFTQAVNESLYLQFGPDREAREIKKLRESLLQVLLSILHEVAAISGETAHYEEFLSDSAGLLASEASVDEIKTIVERIIAETKSIVAFGKAAQQKISNITEELSTLRKSFEKARDEALKDFLTGVANRKSFDEMLTQMVEDVHGNGKGLCLLIVDIDHFKQFNDTHGHVVGDDVLRFTAQKLKAKVRGGDFVARIGGEEFAILLPDTSLQGARAVAENIRSFFSLGHLKKSAGDQKLGRITVSIGAASCRPGESTESLMLRADQALYAAKDAGRDCVVLAPERDLAPAHPSPPTPRPATV